MRKNIANFVRTLAAGTALVAVMPAVANAQNADDQDRDSREIVVTGTLIRGIAPAGSSVVGISEQEAKATGAVTTNQLLANLPQSGFFNSVPVGVSPTAGSNGSNPIARPNLRNLPASNTSGSAQTLVMLDGHRITPLGTAQLAVDPDFISPLVIQRVEAMTDGGSAVYGSDALGGVLNFITKDRFDGVQVTANYGIGDSYKTLDVGGIVGKDWGSGSAYVSYRYAKSDAIFGIDRDYVSRFDPLTGIPTGRNCEAGPNVSAGTGANAATYILSGSSLVRGAALTCDYSDNVAIVPRLESHNVFGSLMQQLSDNLRFDVKLYYAKRDTVGANGTLGNGQLGTGAETLATLTATNPNYRPLPVGDANFGLSQTVRFNLASALGARSARQETNLETFNITPQFSLRLGGDWQARVLFNYGYGNVDFRNAQIGRTQLAAAVASGAFNPYAPTAAAAAAFVFDDIGVGKNEYFNYRAIVDGPLFALPAGDVRVALGAEYSRDNFSRRTTNATTFVVNPALKYTQTVKSLFGELQLPLLANDNGMKLDVSASGRYDKYNDFGDTFNPKVGVTFKPFEALTLRASWGKSFTAPSAPDQLGVATSTAGPVPAAFLQFPPATAGRCGVTGLPACSATGVAGVFLNGAVPNLQPQTAENWSVGFDFKPVDGVYLNASYYRIKLDGTLGRPVTGAILTDFYTGYPDLWIFQPTGQQVAAVLATVPASGVSVSLANPTSTSQALVNLGGPPTPVQVLLDTRVQSLGKHTLTGIDFGAGFNFPTSFGSIDGKVAGNYRLSQDAVTRPGMPVNDQLAFDAVKYVVSTSLGTTIGNLRAQATWNHTPSYKRSANPAGQSRVASFNVVNLYFQYDFAGEGIGKDLALSLNVKNAFDEKPSLFLDAGQPGYSPTNGQGFTLGRIFQFGVTKKF